MDPLRAFRELVRMPAESVDLGCGALCIAQIEHPELEPDHQLKRLDELAARVGRADVHRLRRFLFEEEGFSGNADDYYDPRNSCLNDVLDRRIGIPITLSVLAMEVGRRVGLVVQGIGLPGHFMAEADGVLFDPFNRGVAVSRADAEAVVARVLGRPVPLEDSHFAPVPKPQILLRMLANLRRVYIDREEWAKARAVMERLMLLDPDSPGHVRDYGTVLMKEGNFSRGAAHWEQYLARHPQARDAERVKAQLTEIRRAIASLN
ncbi:MAG: tetratricopeptide repeat protein [Candidatus Rokubacteria bacterium]|nr:tetratricopeptide repeat protein [Candidatus Rokubacteria bacterium]